MLFNKTNIYTFRTDDANCLFNEPIVNPKYQNKSSGSLRDVADQFSDDTILKANFPGEMYDLKKQCQHIFGPESDACEQNLDGDCKILWCKAETSDEMDSAIHCVTTNTKWADGTPCGLSADSNVIYLLFFLMPIT